MTIVPTIDLQNVNEQAICDIDWACRDHGFFKVKGHNLEAQIQKSLLLAQTFFRAPRALKDSIMRPADGAFGYFDKELTQQKRDKKEVFDYAPAAKALHGTSTKRFWPSNENGQLEVYGLGDFELELKSLYMEQTKLAQQLMHILCRAMGENPASLDGMFSGEHTSTARLNHYPSDDPVPENERDRAGELATVALSAHTDPGAVTLLFQDNVGGLQAESTENGWIDVVPEENTFIINIGDIVQAWSNGRYKAAVHRVLPVPENTSRLSLPYFYMPDPDAVIKPIISDEQARYQSFSWSEYISKRIADNFAKVGDKDMHITDFLIE